MAMSLMLCQPLHTVYLLDVANTVIIKVIIKRCHILSFLACAWLFMPTFTK